jgi:FAD-linked sulfhydryl oxidase
MFFDPTVWGPHYWFFLHTIARSYPENPNAVTKRKYYDLIQNMPLFIPETETGSKFSGMLDQYPVSPYLGTRESFVRWVHFVHNKMNGMLGKEEMSFLKSVDLYESQYRPRPVKLGETLHMRKHYLYAIVIFASLFAIYALSE